jgi:hypothetical protein
VSCTGRTGTRFGSLLYTQDTSAAASSLVPIAESGATVTFHCGAARSRTLPLRCHAAECVARADNKTPALAGAS